MTQPGGTHDQGDIVDLGPNTDIRTTRKMLQDQADRFVRDQVCESIIAWCAKRCHRYRDSLDGELIVKAQYSEETFQITATYRHRLPEGILICSAQANVAESKVASSTLASVDEWVKLLNSIANTLRMGLDLDFRKSGATIRQKDFGWYEAGRGWSKPTGGVALPPPPVVDADEEAQAIKAVQKSIRALAEKENPDE